ncbi:MAG: hypothetical protein RLZZ31_1465 [Actinomycetota bacterium]
MNGEMSVIDRDEIAKRFDHVVNLDHRSPVARRGSVDLAQFSPLPLRPDSMRGASGVLGGHPSQTSNSRPKECLFGLFDRDGLDLESNRLRSGDSWRTIRTRFHLK